MAGVLASWRDTPARTAILDFVDRVTTEGAATFAGPRLRQRGRAEAAPDPSQIGVRPILAAGNSAGDAEMLEFAWTGPLPSLALVIDHDDAECEYACESRSATDATAEPILETASRHGWQVVTMRRYWSTVFGASVAT